MRFVKERQSSKPQPKSEAKHRILIQGPGLWLHDYYINAWLGGMVCQMGCADFGWDIVHFLHKQLIF